MFVRFRQLENVGRFGGWDTSTSCREQARLKRLSLIYGRNGAGKTTLVRMMAAAATGAGLERERLLGAIGSPRVTLELAEGRARYDEDGWSGPRPRVRVFDRDFIDRNVFVGRRTSKDQRRHLLELALGADDVQLAKRIEELNARGRELAKERREHDAAIAAVARSAGMSTAMFVAVQPLSDPAGERAAAEACHRAAVAADALGKLARPESLPAIPAIDFTAIEQLLATASKQLGREVAAKVEDHLGKRLRGAGNAWVRDGLDHADGKTCPFCAQSVERVELIEMYRAWFDRAYDELIARIDAARARVGELDAWWREVQRVGAANVRVFESWAQFAEVTRPPFDSAARKLQLAELARGVTAVLDAKRRDAGRAADASGLAALRRARDELAAAVATYNAAIRAACDRIAARLREVGGLPVAEAQRRLARVAAAIERYAPVVVAHVGELARLDREHEQLRADKEREAARLRDEGTHRLAAFAARMNAVLAALGADFQLDELGSERAGGAAAARLALRVERGTLEVATARDEEVLERVLGDGDRSTLAFAVFLLSLDDTPDLADHVVVLDDPMTSQDELRAQRTADQIGALAARTAQTIVLSHDARFLQRVADRGRAARVELVELQLDKDRRAIVPWSASERRREASPDAPIAPAFAEGSGGSPSTEALTASR